MYKLLFSQHNSLIELGSIGIFNNLLCEQYNFFNCNGSLGKVFILLLKQLINLRFGENSSINSISLFEIINSRNNLGSLGNSFILL